VSAPANDDGCWYFAYGSNMQRATFIERRGMQPRDVRRAYVDDHRLCFDLPIGPGERGVANLVVEPGARTWGVAYHLSAGACDFLDRTEGVDRGFYRRIAIAAVTDEGERLAAFAYPRRTPRRPPQTVRALPRIAARGRPRVGVARRIPRLARVVPARGGRARRRLTALHCSHPALS
jgi:cation transport regulator ChaC